MTVHDAHDPARDRVALLRQVIELLAQTGPSQPTAVGISLGGGDVEFAVKPLEHADVVRAVAGFRAPDAWHAFAVVAPGTARHLDGGPPRAVVVGALAARDGFTTSALVGVDDVDASARDDGDGRVLDACRRVLGLPTPPPTIGPQWWAAVHWVERVLRAVLDAELGRAPTWPSLRRLDDGARYARRPWAALRRACAAGRVQVADIGRVDAAWMDDGMFSREALGGYPPLQQLVADLRELLPWSCYEQLLAALCERLEAT
jgi:hypothetical protein